MTLICWGKSSLSDTNKNKPLKMDWLPHGWLRNLEFYLFHPTDFVSVSKKDSLNVSLKFSGAKELCPHKTLGNKLSENSMFVWIIENKLSHSVRHDFLIKNSTKYNRCFHDIRNFLISEIKVLLQWHFVIGFSFSIQVSGVLTAVQKVTESGVCYTRKPQSAFMSNQICLRINAS